MRIESVSITAFGPFKDRTLTFSPRMTVVHGPNEAGKSTWHAAAYAAVCGIRRAPGKRKEDKEFEERYRPWDSEVWRVGACIVLADGRRVKIDQELVHRVNCSAQLLDPQGLEAGDVSQEIINEGTPDASRWLGLDRRSFLSTACVRQAELPRIAEDSEELQVQLQRAAATGGADATAAAALEAIHDFFGEHVGLDRPNSTRPLRRATVRLTEAHNVLERVSMEHASYLRLASDTEDARKEHDKARQRVRQAERAPLDTSADASLAERGVEPSGNQDSVLTVASDFQSARQRQQIHREAAPAGTSPEPVSRFTPLIPNVR